MKKSEETVLVRANVEMTIPALQAIVKNAKAIAGADEKGITPVNTADTVSEIITKFLKEKDFEAYTRNIANYSKS